MPVIRALTRVVLACLNRHQVARAGRSTTGRATGCPFVRLERAAHSSAEYISLRACQLPGGEVVVRRQHNARSPLDSGGRPLDLMSVYIAARVVGLLHRNLSSGCNDKLSIPPCSVTREICHSGSSCQSAEKPRVNFGKAKSSGGAVEVQSLLPAIHQRISRAHLLHSPHSNIMRPAPGLVASLREVRWPSLAPLFRHTLRHSGTAD